MKLEVVEIQCKECGKAFVLGQDMRMVKVSDGDEWAALIMHKPCLDKFMKEWHNADLRSDSETLDTLE